MKHRDPLEEAADEFGEAWEKACHKAGTQGLINVLIMVGSIFAILIIVGLIGNWLGFQ